MDLSGLPQCTVVEIQTMLDSMDTRILGQLSHTAGVRNERGFLYRAAGPSIVGDLEAVPTAASKAVVFMTPDAAFAPELRVGATYPWLDGYWQPRHLTMVLAPANSWRRTTFVPTPARYFRDKGVTGWQKADAPLPAGVEDLGLRSGGWNHEHCELCNVQIGTSGLSDAYMNSDDLWLCIGCYDRYASNNDVSFAVEL